MKFSWGRKSWVIIHKNGQKCSKSRVLSMPLESCTGVIGHRNPPGIQKLWVITARVVCRGSQGIKILPGPKPTKMARNARNHEFCRCLLSRVPGVTGHRNPPGIQKSWVITTRVVCRGSQVIKILPGLMSTNASTLADSVGPPSHRNPPRTRKTARVVCRGSVGIKMLPRPVNHGL